MRLSRRLIRLWSNFAKSGTPSDPANGPLMQWPTVPTLYTFQANEGQAPLSDLATYRPQAVSFWRDLLPNLSWRDRILCEAPLQKETLTAGTTRVNVASVLLVALMAFTGSTR